jgi:hypothetical protein
VQLVWIYKLALDACHYSRSLVLHLIFRFILIRPLSLAFNMYLRDLLASHSLLILIVLLVAPTPSDALPVNASLQFPRANPPPCIDGRPRPCMCGRKYGIGKVVDRKEKCGPTIFAFDNNESGSLTPASIASYTDDINM